MSALQPVVKKAGVVGNSAGNGRQLQSCHGSQECVETAGGVVSVEP